MTHTQTASHEPNVAAALERATKKVAPVWPLESFVAVNPYMGMIGERFGAVAETLARVAGARSTMPLSFYAQALADCRMTMADVEAALAAHRPRLETNAAALVAEARAARDAAPVAAVPTVADVATTVTGHDWSAFTVERVSAWAAAHFDEGQAFWRPAPARTLYAAWREEAALDRTPDVMGLRGFRAAVASLPEAPVAAAAEALRRLGVPAVGLDLYLHRLLLRVGGWSAYAARVVWDRALYDAAQDDTLVQHLAVLLSFELGLHEALAGKGVPEAWQAALPGLTVLARTDEVGRDLAKALVLQDAYERAAERRLVEAFAARPEAAARAGRPDVQAVFCIDVRSEVYRRHLEAVAPEVQTLGFAGFFAFSVRYVPLGKTGGGAHCPVLLTPGFEVEERIADPAAHARAVRGRQLAHEVKRAWTSFKMGAISCFSFVGPIGLAYLPKLFTDGFGITRPVKAPDADALDAAANAARGPRLDPGTLHGRATGIPLEARVELAAGALGAMSLTDGFARLVLLAGHGSTTANNPHATGLDCGACGGRTGEANARVAAAVLNDPEVRRALAGRGITIPADTVFLAGQHDTATDDVTVFDRASVPASHATDLAALDRRLAEAGRRTRAERALRLHLAAGAPVDAAVRARSNDWAQVRPEWGLAGCSAFVAAPRGRSIGVDLGGQAFLHDYRWQQDDGFGVLELIMTAPMVVASWISLQYYASTVENRLFGCGNKTLHNVVGTVGVLEGNAGDLRVGLPWQSVHDGDSLQHDPVRLKVVIEAPIEAMNAVIAKHAMVRDLVDHGWLHLYAMDARGRIAHRYAGDLRWEPIDGAAAPAKRVERAPAAMAAPAA